MAARYDLNIDQGRAFRRVFTWLDDDDSAIDLSDYTAQAQLREVEGAAGGPALEATSDGGGITLGDDGTIDLRFTSAQTGELAEAPYVWELVLVPPSGEANDSFSLLKGQVNISGRVTA